MRFCLRNSNIGVARGKGGHVPQKILAYLVILCFETWCPKPDTVALLKSKYLTSPETFGLATSLNSNVTTNHCVETTLDVWHSTVEAFVCDVGWLLSLSVVSRAPAPPVCSALRSGNICWRWTDLFFETSEMFSLKIIGCYVIVSQTLSNCLKSRGRLYKIWFKWDRRRSLKGDWGATLSISRPLKGDQVEVILKKYDLKEIADRGGHLKEIKGSLIWDWGSRGSFKGD